MLSLFRTNQLILGVFLLGYALLLRFWLPFSVGFSTVELEYPLLSGWVKNMVDGVRWLPAVFAIILVWLQAILINGIVARHRLASEVNLFPGLFYILLSSALPAFQDLSPIHLANTFLILSVGQIFKIYKVNRCMDLLFNAGIFIGMASLFYGPYFLFLIPILIGLNIQRAFKSREWLAVITGALIPLLWLVILGFLLDKHGTWWSEWKSTFGFMDWDFSASWGEIIGFYAYMLLIIWVLLNYNTNRQSTIIEVRKKASVLYWILFFGGVLAIFGNDLSIAYLLFISLPLSIFLSFIFIRMRRAFAESLHLLLLIGILVLHYLTYANYL